MLSTRLLTQSSSRRGMRVLSSISLSMKFEEEEQKRKEKAERDFVWSELHKQKELIRLNTFIISLLGTVGGMELTGMVIPGMFIGVGLGVASDIITDKLAYPEPKVARLQEEFQHIEKEKRKMIEDSNIVRAKETRANWVQREDEVTKIKFWYNTKTNRQLRDLQDEFR